MYYQRGPFNNEQYESYEHYPQEKTEFTQNSFYKFSDAISVNLHMTKLFDHQP